MATNTTKINILCGTPMVYTIKPVGTIPQANKELAENESVSELFLNGIPQVISDPRDITITKLAEEGEFTISYKKSCGRFVEYSFRFFSNTLNEQVFSITENLTLNYINSVVGNIANFTFQKNAGAIQTAAQILNTTFVNSDTLTVRNTSTNFTDVFIQVGMTASGVLVSPFDVVFSYPQNTAMTFGFIDQDQIIALTNKVTINSVIASQPCDLVYALRTFDYTIDNYTEYPYTNIAALQAAIDLLAENTPYGIHIYSEWTTTTVGNITVNMQYQTAVKQFKKAFDHLEDTNFRKLNESWFLNGSSHYGNFVHGANDRLTFPNGVDYDTILNINKVFTYSCWVKNSISDTRLISWHSQGSNIGGGGGVPNQSIFTIDCSYVGCTFVNPSGTIRYNNLWQLPLFVVTLPYKWNHIVVAYNANNGCNFYFNGKKQSGIHSVSDISTDLSANQTFKTGLSIGGSVNSPTNNGSFPDYFINGNLAEMILMPNYLPTDAEVWQVYKSSQNLDTSPAGYVNYPVTWLANGTRIFHFPCDALNIDNVNGKLLDISKNSLGNLNNNHLQVFGQGITPIIQNFY